MSLKVHFDTRALAEQVQAMREDVQAATRPAAQAGSQVLYDAVKANVPRSTEGHWFHGTSFKKTGQKYWFNPGTLSKAIYQVYSKDNSTNGKATYQISWNHKKAPYGHMVEYGTRRSQPVAFVRRAGLQMPAALQAAEAEFMRHLKVFK
jgi:HK97 gp10 family phage protein